MEPRLETVLTDIGSSFRCLDFTCPDFASDHTWHYHPEFELVWVGASEGTRFVGDSIQRYGPGDLVLLGPYVPHRWLDDPVGGARRELTVIGAQFKPDCLGADFFELCEARPVADLLRRAAGGLAFAADVSTRMGPLLQSLAHASGLRRLARLIDLLDALSAAPSEPLATDQYRYENEINLVGRRRLDRVYRYIRENIDDAICQAEIAGQLGMSAPAFSRFFKGVTGRTFVGFVSVVRVHEACRKLSAGDDSITHIALACGFQNLSNFNRQFLALKEMTPSEFRRRARQRDKR